MHVEAEAFLERDERVEQFGHATAVRRGVQLEDPGAPQLSSELPDVFELLGGHKVDVRVDALGGGVDETQHQVTSAWATASRRDAAVISGDEGLTEIPEPSSNPAGVVSRGTICRCQRK